ncbi:MAG TPA: tRNA (adenosine(37)-N6)-threonylcarbamoyltransferase complex ATPase subunit type 1 TsaE [Flavobacteriaceae bacterium]|nr:tRNA (adenosine(37)-N6)-threonylcarbamoyltransferase complex ATPase subunit type 1 TsaE [Flavobacteriaceae bacterium]
MELLYTLDELSKVASEILSFSSHRSYLFYGAMGSGKTTLIKEMCRQLDIEGEASSPTFGIVNEYASPSGPVYHFDFYRLKTPEEAMDIGIEEYFDSGFPVFIEWPEKIGNYLPDNSVRLEISKTEKGGRKILVSEIEA